MVAAAMVGAAVVGGGMSMMAADTQAGAAENAAGMQAQATAMSVQEQRRQFDLMRSDMAPYRETGASALQQYGALYGVGQNGPLSQEEMKAAQDRFMTTPGYEFRMGEGVKALDRSAAARGGLRSGGYGRELTRYGQGVASAEFENYANRLAGIAGMGQGATTASATMGMQSAANIGNTMQSGAAQQGNYLMQSGTARASGYAGVGQAATGAANNYMMYSALKGQ